MSDGKKAKKNKKVKKLELEEVELEEDILETDEDFEEEDEEAKPKKSKKLKKSEAKELKPKKEKKSKKGLIAFLIILVLLIGGGFAAKTFLTKTTVSNETVKLASVARGFSNYFKEYIVDRLEAENLLNYSYKELSDEEILNKLSLLKDGFSKLSRGLSGNYKATEYKELAEVMKGDSDEYLTIVRELRNIITGGGSGEEKRVAFGKKVEETLGTLRSAVYISRAAFEGEVPGFSSKGVLAFQGKAMAEVGGGVANIFVGNTEDGVVAVSSDKLENEVKAIEAEKLFGYTGARVFEIGKSLKSSIESGWFKNIKADVKNSEVMLETTRISTILKNVKGMNEELEGQGIKGLLEEREEKSKTEEINEMIVGIKGRQ